MRDTLVLIFVVSFLTLGTAGCKKKSNSVGVLQPTLTAWQKGDQATAIKLFVEADWTGRPMFSSGSPLDFTEKQFEALSKAEQEATAQQFMPQLSELRELARAVIKAGQEAAGQKEAAKARKLIVATQQFGDALNHPDHMQIVHLVGKAVRKTADDALAGLAP